MTQREKTKRSATADQRLALSDAEYEGWPVTFYVCPHHKITFFSDYDLAIISEEHPCPLCNEVYNDSLGG